MKNHSCNLYAPICDIFRHAFTIPPEFGKINPIIGREYQAVLKQKTERKRAVKAEGEEPSGGRTGGKPGDTDCCG